MPPDTTPRSLAEQPTGPQNATIAPRVSIDALIFDVIMLAFLGALLLTLPESGAARLLPMLVVIPTFIGVAYQLYVDLTPRHHVEEAADDEIAPPDVRRRQATFAAWLLAYFALAWVTSFLLMIPIALFALFRFVNREPLLRSALLAAGMWAFIYVLFGLFLGVRF